MNNPVYDRKTLKVINGLKEGKTREQLADELGYSSWKSVDQHMRRRDLKWDRKKNAYVPKNEEKKNDESEKVSLLPLKAKKIINKISDSNGKVDPREIAISEGFKDHRDMANYMLENGFLWDVDLGNYVDTSDLSNDRSIAVSHQVENTIYDNFEYEDIQEETIVEEEISFKANTDRNGLSKYLPVLDLLDRNKEVLEKLLSSTTDGKIPRYAVPGEPKTKSVYMSSLLSRVVHDFCEAKNLSQREVIEAALVEYLRSYGFDREVERLLKS